MKKKFKKLICAVALFAAFFTAVPFSAARPADRNVVAVCSDLPPSVKAPFAD